MRDNSPDLVSLNETWLQAKHNVSFSGYHVIRQDRPDGRGGIAIIIKRNIPFKIINHNLNTNQNVQVLIIELKEVIVINTGCPTTKDID